MLFLMDDSAEDRVDTETERVPSLDCRKGFSIRVNNIRRVVILFDALLENSLIQSRWQNVLGKMCIRDSNCKPLFFLSRPKA